MISPFRAYRGLLLLLFAIVAATFTPARSARVDDHQSIEMSVLSAPLVVRGRIRSAEVYGPLRAGIDQTRVVVEVEESLKGMPPHPLIFAAYGMTEDAPIHRQDVGRDMLLFLQPSHLGVAERRDCVGCESELLTDPGGANVVQFIDLSGVRRQSVWCADITQLNDLRQILAAARAASRLPNCAPFVVKLADEEQLWIPDDGSLARRAETWSQSVDPNQRSAAVDVLGAGLPDRGIPELYRLLGDQYLAPAFKDEQRVGPWTIRSYSIRMRAFEALRYWRLADEPVQGVNPGVYRPIPLWPLAVISFGIIVFVAAREIRLRRKGRRRARRGGWAFAAAIGVFISASIAWSFNRSLDIVDGHHGSIRAIELIRGRIQFRIFTLNPGFIFEPKRVWACFRAGTGPTPWYDGDPSASMRDRSAWDAAGISIYSGHDMVPMDPFFIAPCRYVSVPLWPLIVIAALPAALFVLRRGRARRRVAAGRCANCDYDLRASSDRCPECGCRISQHPARVARSG